MIRSPAFLLFILFSSMQAGATPSAPSQQVRPLVQPGSPHLISRNSPSQWKPRTSRFSANRQSASLDKSAVWVSKRLPDSEAQVRDVPQMRYSVMLAHPSHRDQLWFWLHLACEP